MMGEATVTSETSGTMKQDSESVGSSTTSLPLAENLVAEPEEEPEIDGEMNVFQAPVVCTLSLPVCSFVD